MKTIFKRFTSESPTFFKRLQALMISLGSAGGVIVGLPMAVPQITIPEALLTLGYHLITIGVIGTAISKLTVADPSVLNPPTPSEGMPGDNKVSPPATPK